MSQKYKKTSDGIYDLKVHIVWITKYRFPVLQKKIAYRLRDLVRQICAENDIEIISGNIASDHIHIFIAFLSTQYLNK